ncbi:MAG TPA: HAMP domain-containing sensor histidine kinase [Myxococcaceae bacterium]|nr:HAMP domain-containing sensor histidine kinase [Myxococcaceae bacterium]
MEHEAEAEGMGPAVAIFGPDGGALGASARFLQLAGARALPEGAGFDTLLPRLGFEPDPDHPDQFRKEGLRVRARMEMTAQGLVLLWLEEPEAEHARARFLSIASHDLRGPIANVRSYASFVLDTRADLDPKLRKQLEVIQRNADRALQLVREVFDSSKAQHRRLELAREPQPLAPSLHRVVAAVQPQAQERDVTVTADIPGEVPEGPVDKEAFEHALAAFLEHGLSRAEPGGQVLLTAAVKNGVLRVEVADSGPELSEGESRHIFDRDRRTTAEGKLGSGFRLALARAQVASHGGSVGVERRGERTVFYFTLPLH